MTWAARLSKHMINKVYILDYIEEDDKYLLFNQLSLFNHMTSSSNTLYVYEYSHKAII